MVIPETWRGKLKLLTFLTLCAIMVGVKCGKREQDLLVTNAISRQLGADEVLQPKRRRTTKSDLRDAGESAVGRPDDRNEPRWYSVPPRFSPRWDTRTGDLHIKRYGFSLAPGLQMLGPKAVGLDFRIARAGDFGLQVGTAYFFDDRRIGETVTLGYNLRKTKMLSNVDLLVGGSYTRSTILVGLRIELGQK